MLTFAPTLRKEQRRDIAASRIVARAAFIFAFAVTSMLVLPAIRAQQVVDRIVARIEGDVLLLSDLRELGQFQQLQGEKVEPEPTRLNELIDQWIIEHEGQAAQFPEPSEADVTASVDKLKKDLDGEEIFQKRLKETGLSQAAVQRMLRRVLFFSRYIDYKFRTAVQIDPAAEEKYYSTEFADHMKARGEKLPPLDSVRPAIHELLVQEDISKHAAEWLTESRSRIKVEMVPAALSSAPGNPAPTKQLEH
jgi:hypothetical protein